MPRRPLHLRWIYVKDHAPWFAALAAVFVLAVVASELLASDPARGLLVGILPTALALLVWALTNRAGWPDRAPATMAHQRAVPGVDGPSEAEAWDPFERERRVVEETDSVTVPGDDRRAELDDATTTTPPAENDHGKGTPAVEPAPDGAAESRSPDVIPAKSKHKPTTPKSEPASPSTPGNDSTKPHQSDSLRGSQEQSKKKPRAKRAKPAPRSAPGNLASPPDGSGTAPAAAPSRRDPKADGGDPFGAQSAMTPPVPQASDGATEHLTPAEAAIRAAAAQKRGKKRKGTPGPT